jgi:hypothetical protein
MISPPAFAACKNFPRTYPKVFAFASTVSWNFGYLSVAAEWGILDLSNKEYICF